MIFPELFPDCETEHLAQIFAENRIAEKLFRQSFGRRKEDRQVDRQDRHAEYLDRQEIKRQAEYEQSSQEVIIILKNLQNPKGISRLVHYCLVQYNTLYTVQYMVYVQYNTWYKVK